MLLLIGTLLCTAPFDDGSYYQLKATVKEAKVVGPLKFSYVTNDGLDLKADLKVTSQAFGENSFTLEGTNGNMAIKAGADKTGPNYEGALGVSFNYDGTPPVETTMTCELK